MGMSNPGLIKAYKAGGSISKFRLVKLSADDTVVAASAATDAVFGVLGELDADSGDRVDVVLSGIAEVEFGGNVTRGALLTSDANGKAVAAAPAAGVNNRVIGVACESGVAGDIGSVLIAHSSFQGA